MISFEIYLFEYPATTLEVACSTLWEALLLELHCLLGWRNPILTGTILYILLNECYICLPFELASFRVLMQYCAIHPVLALHVRKWDREVHVDVAQLDLWPLVCYVMLWTQFTSVIKASRTNKCISGAHHGNRAWGIIIESINCVHTKTGALWSTYPTHVH